MIRFIRNFFADIRTDLFHSSLLLSGSVIAQVISFLAYPVLTRLYSPEQFGEFSVFLSITGVLGIIATLRFEYALMIPENEEEAINLKRAGLWWCTLFSLLNLGVILFISLFENIASRIPGLYLIPLAVFFTGFLQFFTFYRNRSKEYKKLAKMSVVQNAFSTVTKIIIGFFKLIGDGLILGNFIGYLAAAVVIGKGSISKSLFSFPSFKSLLKKYSDFPKYRMPQAMINTLSSNMPIFFLTYYFSAKEAGYFALILGIGYRIIVLVSSALYQVLFKRFVELKNEGRSVLPLFKKNVLLFLLVSGLPALLILPFSKEIILLIFGDKWIETSTYLLIMAPWLIIVFISSPFAFIADVFSLQKEVLIIDIIHLIARISVLFVGFFMGNVYISIILYCIISVVFLCFQMIWYYRKLRRAEWKISMEYE